MSKESQIIDPAGRCVHGSIDRECNDDGYTYRWVCHQCREEWFSLDLMGGKMPEPRSTLRDQFAMSAMTTLLADSSRQDRNVLANAAYFYADGMMEARKR